MYLQFVSLAVHASPENWSISIRGDGKLTCLLCKESHWVEQALEHKQTAELTNSHMISMLCRYFCMYNTLNGGITLEKHYE